MRILLLVQRADSRDKHFVMRDIVTDAMEQLQISYSTAYRLIRQAVDLLGIPYESDAIRAVRISERRADAITEHRCMRRAA
jgi:predicted transcriptional regulator